VIPDCTCPPDGLSATCPRHGLERILKSSKQPKAPGRRKPLRRVSDKQSLRNAFLDGIKSERIAHALLVEGKVSCALCPRSFTDMRAAKNGLQLHHEDKRSHGQGYRPQNMGVDAPRNLVLLCGGQDGCHAKVESNPEWSKSA
jgi:hypothetical protein